MKIIDKKYSKSFQGLPCLIMYLQGQSYISNKNYSHDNLETTVPHHLIGRLRDDLILPFSFHYHTGDEGIHTIGKKTWYDKYMSKEDCIKLAKFSYTYRLKYNRNLFSLDNISEILDIYFE